MAATISARRQALADMARSRRAEGSTGRWVRRIAAGVIVLAVISWAILWLLGFFSTPKEVLAVRALVDGQVAELERVARNEVPLSYEGGSFGAMFETMRQVPEAYRDQARAEMGRLFAARERAEIDSFFAMPPAQRQAELDRRIQAEDARRRAWQAERASREASRGTEAARGGDRGQEAPAAACRRVVRPAGRPYPPDRRANEVAVAAAPRSLATCEASGGSTGRPRSREPGEPNTAAPRTSGASSWASPRDADSQIRANPHSTRGAP
jgi:hypothetical protein